jgi:hypothetical protein
MRNLILYQSSYRTIVLGVDRYGKPSMSKLSGCNFCVNLKTGEILKDRSGNRAGTLMNMDELRPLRVTHNYTQPDKRHFDEDLFTL